MDYVKLLSFANIAGRMIVYDISHCCQTWGN